MSKKRIITSVLSFFVVVIIYNYFVKYGILAITGTNIKVMEYTPPTVIGDSRYQIDKYEDVGSVEWLNEDEILTLTRKEDFINSDSVTTVSYCGIYNLNTKESKDFREVNICEFLGASPDKKYVLYSEPRVIPKIGSDEWKKAYESGDLLHKNVKLLNLFTGESTDLNTKKINSSAEFRWVGNNKVLVNYYTHWDIIDINGKVYVDGNYSGKEHENPYIAGIDDIKDLGDSVEGKFYYTQDVNGSNGGRVETKLCYIDVKTKEIKTLCSNEDFYREASKKSNTIVIGKSNFNGADIDRSEVVIDKSGNTIRSIDTPKGKVQSDYILSPDGNKVAYTEGNDSINPDDNEVVLKVIDIKTGEVKEIFKPSTLKDEIEYTTMISPNGEREGKVPIKKYISNVCWSSTSKEISFTYGSSISRFSKFNINTYIVSFYK